MTTATSQYWRVWKDSTGKAIVEPCAIEFRTKKFVWVHTGRKWGKKNSHNQFEIASGRSKYSDGPNRELLFDNLDDARAYASSL